MGDEAFFAFLKDFAGQMAGTLCYTPSDALHYKTHVSIYVLLSGLPTAQRYKLYLLRKHINSRQVAVVFYKRAAENEY